MLVLRLANTEVTPLLERYGKYIFLTPQRIKKTETFFSRHGGKVIVIARFVEGLRQINGIVAGISEMKWLKFLTFNIIGAALWVGLWSTIGYFGGSPISIRSYAISCTSL